ncbi:hypothetical protein ScalyP_jg5511 [Parmales sp. scaly parma]|nr:hypothetical protein ScalyP_jg5511 [Parmales sp. scaly parma]
MIIRYYIFFCVTFSSTLNTEAFRPVHTAFRKSPTQLQARYAVVGAGWAGWGAAKALSEASPDNEVFLIDSLLNPTGETPYTSASNKPVEAGVRGFWYDYPNINNLVKTLNLDEKDIFTSYTNSSFFSPDGLEATAPVFQDLKLPIPEQFLPSPLPQVFATFKLFERIPIADRTTLVGLLLAVVDCLGSPEDSPVRSEYDKMTAATLFEKFKVSPRLVEDFIKPTLLVGLFKPPEELSALVTMELLYFYALAHKESFDVRWIKNGTVADSLILPMANHLLANTNLKVMGGTRVTKITTNSTRVGQITYTDSKGKEKQLKKLDGAVLALGTKGFKSVVLNSPDLLQYHEFKAPTTLDGIDVISLRLYLNKEVKLRTPANVLSKFEALRGAGGTFFALSENQKETEGLLWGGAKVEGSVLACDLYNSVNWMDYKDDEIVSIFMKDLLSVVLKEDFVGVELVDSWVGKYPGAVSWFSPGSYDKRPRLHGNQNIENLKCAGDWVRMGADEHGSKGLCQERAFVSGLTAANKLIEKSGSSSDKLAEIVPVRDDELFFTKSVELNRKLKVPRFWL